LHSLCLEPRWGIRGDTHRDFGKPDVFTLYALDQGIALSMEATAADLRDAIAGHVLESAELVGRNELAAG
jgi:hypothetical protein